ncbi:YihY/virulence factor BrkB family protein [Microbacterium sp. AK031]|uniref:YihY/virulence factor BrkB family protein n=1 Tax=Microbacterium sp. AK031 TaxID=2723076 RepID=UPI002167B893|nr:YihY/virulence factor BrkB family protein [Microbacterium sp. AK031]MCS3842936.1 membrane protein [Microbacterium sp. AK031]
MPNGASTNLNKVSNPTQLRKQTWVYACRRTLQEFAKDGCVDGAGALTFFGVLSIFPAGLAIVASIGILADSERVLDRLLSLLDEVAPRAVTDTLRAPLAEAAGASTAGLTLIVAIVTAVWSASLYVGAFGRVLNRIYGVDEGRPYWKRKPAQLGVTIILLLLVLIVVAVVVLSGPVSRVVGGALNIGDAALTTWDVLKWPMLTAAVVSMITLLYKGTSNLKQPPLRWLSIGAVLAVAMLAISSAGFIAYVSNFADYNRTFGTFAGVIIFLLWLFLINLALLFGAEFNAELERGRQLQAGQKAESQLQRSPRDTTVSERAARSQKITEERGIRLRRGETLVPRSDTLFKRSRRFLEKVSRGLNRRRP